MSESSTESSIENPTIGETSIVENTLNFSFTMRPVFVLKNAFDALSNSGFNPKEEAVIQVSNSGFEITVVNYNSTVIESFGYLGLKSSGLEEFLCRKSMRKVFNWNGILELFQSSKEIKAEYVKVFVVEGSNQLSFQLGSTANDFDPGLPVTIDLKDDVSPFVDFPNVSYVFENVLPSKVLRAMFIKARNQVSTQPNKVQVSLETATIEVNFDGVTSRPLDEYEEEQEDELTITMQCRHWGALESATWTANKCSVYVVTDPDASIVLRFHLEELGDLVFLSQAEFDNLDQLTVLGHFGRLN